jgi:hypothetical protein
MSRRRWSLWLGPPIAPVAGVIVVLAGVVAGCYGTRPVASAAASAASSAAPSSSDGVSTMPSQGRNLIGRAWLAEGPRGWEAGRVGGGRVALAKSEIGIAAHDRWIVSAIVQPAHPTKLLVRDGPRGDPKAVDLGGLAPTATVIVGDRAFVSGSAFAKPQDPGIVQVDLNTASSRVLVAPSGARGTRYLAASEDGATLVSTLCDLAADPEPATCALLVVALKDGAETRLGDVPGGILRGTSSEVAVVAPQGAEPPGWIAGIDLHTGRELWRLTGGEFGPSVVVSGDRLVQQRLLIGGTRPRLVIDLVDLRTGASRKVYEESGSVLRGLWPALCSDTEIALGDDTTGSRALAAGPAARTSVRLVPVDGGSPADVDLTLRSTP